MRADGGKDLVVVVSDGTGAMSVRFFRQDYLAAKLQRGMQIVLSGKVTYFRDMKQMANPEWEELDKENLHTIGIVPVYRMTKGLRPRLFRRIIKSLIDEWVEKIPDPLPPALLDRANWLTWAGRCVKRIFLKAGIIEITRINGLPLMNC